MTNEQKYKTPEERVKAFYEFLDKRCGKGICEKCEVHALCVKLNYDGKFVGWLALDEKKPEPCPFCGSDMHYRVVHRNFVDKHWFECTNGQCEYQSGKRGSKEAAIDAHNHVARAVRDVKLAHETMNKIENSTINFCNYERETIRSILKRYREASCLVMAVKESESEKGKCQ